MMSRYSGSWLWNFRSGHSTKRTWGQGMAKELLTSIDHTVDVSAPALIHLRTILED